MNDIITPHEIIENIHDGIDGRMCDEQNNCLFLASTIFEAGGGNYLEIGALFGGTAIMASLVMQSLGYEGEVYSIDPFDQYYKNTRNDKGHKIGYEVDPITHKAVTIERARANAEKLGGKVNFIKGKADGVTLHELGDMHFSVIYIDGDHWNDAPLRDFKLVCDRADKFIVFDNCDVKHPAVEQACALAWQERDWTLTFKQGATAIFKRTGWTTCR